MMAARPVFSKFVSISSKIKFGPQKLAQNEFSTSTNSSNLLTPSMRMMPTFKNEHPNPLIVTRQRMVGSDPKRVGSLEKFSCLQKSTRPLELLLSPRVPPPLSAAATAVVSIKSQSASYASLSSLSLRKKGGRKKEAKDDKLKILIFYGSTRDGRYVERVGKYVRKVLEDTGGLQVTVFDPLHLKFEMLKTPVHFYRDPSKVPSWLKHIDTQIKNADGYVIISTEYNSLPPPALLNMLDHFPPASYGHRPTALVTYAVGMFGGARAGGTLGSMMSDLGMVPIPTSVHIPQIDKNFEDDSGTCRNELTVKTIKYMGQLILWYAGGLKKVREANPPPQFS